jgi:hypothetical protein
MEKINDIFNFLKTDTPQALSRFNDGEATAITEVGSVIARGDQKVSSSLQEALANALKHEQERYWKGIPCKVCIPHQYIKIESMINPEYKWLTCAVVTTNRNWKRMVTEFPKLLVSKRVIWVGGEDQDMKELGKRTNIHPSDVIRVPCKNAWDVYDSALDEYPSFDAGDVVILSCGPLSRVLACEWYKLRPDVTFLDVGSCFDPYTRNVWHSCHKGTLKPCKGCN